jgi:hypothetical protein
MYAISISEISDTFMFFLYCPMADSVERVGADGAFSPAFAQRAGGDSSIRFKRWTPKKAGYVFQ